MVSGAVKSGDLGLGRVVDVPRYKIWRTWTEPDLLMRWFTPAPWETIECQVDLRPGGAFRTVMRGPDGTVMDEGAGCYLEVVKESRLVFTSALGPGFRPQESDGFAFTAVLYFEDVPSGTRYRARLLHANAEDTQTHADMGFQTGWSAALDQLIAIADDID